MADKMEMIHSFIGILFFFLSPFFGWLCCLTNVMQLPPETCDWKLQQHTEWERTRHTIIIRKSLKLSKMNLLASARSMCVRRHFFSFVFFSCSRRERVNRSAMQAVQMSKMMNFFSVVVVVNVQMGVHTAITLFRAILLKCHYSWRALTQFQALQTRTAQ